jgi:TatD related DNase
MSHCKEKKSQLFKCVLLCKILFMLWAVFCKKAIGIPSKISRREFQANIRLRLGSDSNKFSSSQLYQYRMASKGCIDDDEGFNSIHKAVDSNSPTRSNVDLSSASTIESAVRESNPSGMSLLCDFDCNILHKDMLDDKERLADAAGEVGIGYFVVPGSDLESSRDILGLHIDLNGVRLIGSAGVHPYNAAKDFLSEATLNELNGMVLSPNCYAVGECGLDYSNGFPDKDIQIPWFR